MYWIVSKGKVSTYTYPKMVKLDPHEYGLDPQTEWCVVEAPSRYRAGRIVAKGAWPTAATSAALEVRTAATGKWAGQLKLTGHSLVEWFMVRGYWKGL
jgi:hypothetical protein